MATRQDGRIVETPTEARQAAATLLEQLAKLNAAIIRLADRTPPHAIGGQRFKIYYATQTSNRPFRIKVFCNQERNLTESYRRYLEGCIRKEVPYPGLPLIFHFRERETRGESRK